MASLESRCVNGIAAGAARCQELLDRSTAVATALSPILGYARTAEVAKQAAATRRTIREVVLESGLLEASQLDVILSPERMTRPGLAGSEPPS
jgi:aspartate ammonia-lyase